MPREIRVTLSVKMEVSDELHKSLEEGNDVAFDDLASSVAVKLVLPISNVEVIEVDHAE